MRCKESDTYTFASAGTHSPGTTYPGQTSHQLNAEFMHITLPVVDSNNNPTPFIMGLLKASFGLLPPRDSQLTSLAGTRRLCLSALRASSCTHQPHLLMHTTATLHRYESACCNHLPSPLHFIKGVDEGIVRALHGSALHRVVEWPAGIHLVPLAAVITVYCV